MKKILYISSPPFFDLDLSYIKSISDKCDLYYLLDLPPYFLKSNAIEIKEQIQINDIIPLNSYKELHAFNCYLNKSTTYIANRLKSKAFHPQNIKFLLKIFKLIISLKPDVIHLNNYLAITFIPILFITKIPIVTTIHDPFPHIGDKSIRNSIIRFFHNHFSKKIFILNKKQKKDFIKRNRIPKTKVEVSALGPYSFLELYINNKEQSNNENNILFIGRISRYKGVEVLLEAFKLIENKETTLTIAGSGNFWFDIQPYQTNPRIKFINRYITNEELATLINKSRFVVCPYTEATQSGVIMSAYSLNKPVIASNVGGLPEMVDDMHTGILVPPNNPKLLANKMNILIENINLYKKMKENISEKYFYDGIKSWNSITTKQLKILNQLK